MSATIASLIARAERGDSSAAEMLFEAIYTELHRVARRELARHGWGVTIGATSLLHEAYLDMSAREGAAFPDRQRFMAYAARVMRGLIIEYARSRQALKRGGQFEITALTTGVQGPARGEERLEEIGEAIDALAKLEPVLAEVVDLKFFCGFSFGEIAAMKGLSERTVQRHWQKARIYLHRAVGEPVAGMAAGELP
jgi:RNA polymerase sigma factor (TIGR02999 family)